MNMVEQVMRECNNFFDVCCYNGNHKVVNGSIVDVPLKSGEFVAISGSTYNDGVHCGLLDQDEEFNGGVYILHPTKEFLSMCARIEKYIEKNPTGSMVSEQFGAYSYNRGSASSVTGTAAPWQQAFAFELKPYRRMFTEVDL